MAYYARFSKFLRLHRPFPAIVCACVHILAGVCVHVPQLYRHRTHILRMISRFCCGIATRDNSRHGRLNIVQRSSRDMRAPWCGEHLATYAHQTRGARLCETCEITLARSVCITGLCETCAKHVQRKGRAECAVKTRKAHARNAPCPSRRYVRTTPAKMRKHAQVMEGNGRCKRTKFAKSDISGYFWIFLI